MATATPRIVLVGAGIVGCALADELTRRGITDVTVLEQGPLFRTGGSTSHTPGVALQTTGDRTMTRLARATVAKYAGLATQGVRGFRAVGGLEVASTADRLADLHRRQGWAAASGIAARVVDADTCAELHPLLDPDGILGGLHVPSDGVVAPLVAAQAQAGAARRRGATFLPFHRVTAIERSGGRVTGVRCGDARFAADVVVSCAGVWGPLVGGLAGVDVPLVPVAHQYARTSHLGALESVHALESMTGRADPVLPVLRDRDADLYVRDHGDRLGIGARGRRAMPVDPRELDRVDPGMDTPSERRFTPADFEPSWEAAAALLPCLGDAKVEEGVNGVLAVTPDGLPLLGEAPGLRGFWSAEAVWVTHSAGVAEAVAEWIATGRPAVGGEPIDLSALHLDRFDAPELAPDVVRAAVVGAFDDRDAPSVRATPFGSRQVELRAVFPDEGGPACPLWYDANASLPEVCEIPTRHGRAGRSPVSGAEALVTRRAAGLFDLTGRRRVEVTGPRALAFLQRITTTDLDRPVGRVTDTLMLDAGGGVLADITVTRLGPERFLLGTQSRLDVAAVRRWLPRPGVTVTDRTDDTCSLGLWGPAVPAVLDGLVPSLGDRHAAEFDLGGVPVTGLRVSCVGEYGWEITTDAAHAEALWDGLYVRGARHGLVAAGQHALVSLRMESGHRSRDGDVTTEHGPDATGLGSAVSMDCGPFLGRAAVHSARAAGGPARRLVTLVLDHSGAVLDGSEPVRDVPAQRRFTRGPVLLTEGAASAGPQPVIGYVTAAAIGHTVGASIAHAWVPAERAAAGTRVEVESYGRRLGAEVVDGPLHR